MANSESYRDLLIKLLPRGRAWLAEPESFLYKLCWSFGEELARADARIATLLRETDPKTATETLSDWEKEYGLPDSCSIIADTIEGRRRDLRAKITAVGGQAAEYFEDIFTEAGTPITITYQEPSRAGVGRAGERVYGRQWKFIWIVNVPEVSISYAIAGDVVAGEALAEASTDTNVICFLEKNKPAHTNILYTFNS